MHNKALICSLKVLIHSQFASNSMLISNLLVIKCSLVPKVL